ncbi:tRNA (adenosine(37)-N6)-threonylcarbamoyltransferase complex dimerization subunit type 1 TsaB [Mucilaginibacter sp. BT774]|nr:tRNA (adenosine(37)-N6)-threonylcarbamoyltransferase complex dimerization subunit type 1 TsaB [Mucilaginibacter sp. BT774]MDO3628924.1 tRNA (adenosine(37)-N6)-threonylcarbamoyltransferase complex dimerization subunit type 1 TsaB [Mucilaginibacter sp. BT774]
MSLILQIETATTVCSVALSENGSVLAHKEIQQRNVHAEVITLFIDEVLKMAGKQYRQLNAVAVSCGPGSYTGLRIGISVTKGLCYSLDIPFIAVETLEAMTDGMIAETSDNDVLFCPMIDARRMEVFTAIFDAEGQRIRSTSAEIIDQYSFSDLLKTNKIIFFGDGAAKCSEVLGANPHVQIIPDFQNSALHLTEKATEKFINKDFEDTAYFEPYYLKDFIAGKKSV